MSEDPADIDLDKHGPQDPGAVAPRNRRPVLVLAAVGVLLLAGAYLYLWRARPEPSVPAAVAKPSSPAQQAESGEQIALPPLDETDALVRDLVGRLSKHPAVAAWLTTDGLLVNFVMVTAMIADGKTPAGELKAVRPAQPFRTRTSRDLLYIDRASYRRYDRYAEAVSALDARGVARLYATLKPRIRDAYRRTGHLDDEFDPALERALVELLRVPVVEGEVALEPHGIVYAFADPKLEGLSAAQKQFLRMGPQNVRTIQAKLREIASSLGIPASRLPAPPAL